MDFNDILKEVPKFHARPPCRITAGAILAKATAMARRGYVHTEASLRALEAYMQGYGVLLSGGIGVGKTYFFQTVNPEPIDILSFNSCSLWDFDRLDRWLENRKCDEIVLDDLGYEGEKSRNFGQRYDLLQVVLDYRLIHSAGRTHITTNLTNEELIARYDAHLVDRIYECCMCLTFPPAESRREAQINWNWIKNKDYARQVGKEVL